MGEEAISPTQYKFVGSTYKPTKHKEKNRVHDVIKGIPHAIAFLGIIVLLLACDTPPEPTQVAPAPTNDKPPIQLEIIADPPNICLNGTNLTKSDSNTSPLKISGIVFKNTSPNGDSVWTVTISNTLTTPTLEEIYTRYTELDSSSTKILHTGEINHGFSFATPKEVNGCLELGFGNASNGKDFHAISYPPKIVKVVNSPP